MTTEADRCNCDCVVALPPHGYRKFANTPPNRDLTPSCRVLSPLKHSIDTGCGIAANQAGNGSMNGFPDGDDAPPVILLVEDEVLIRLASADLLRDAGYCVLEASNAAEALALLDSNHPVDAVVTDVRMPGEIDGITLARMVKQARPALPVVVASGHLGPEDSDVADHFFRKPYAPERLVETLQELIRPRWQSRPSNTASS